MREFKTRVTTTAGETINLRQQHRKPWISKKCIALTEFRRKHKWDEDEREYSMVRNLINREANKDKEEWFRQCCEDIEDQLN